MKNIIETAQGAGTFSTLLTAATAAGLVDTLANDGPFTIFAPTDEAFAKLPEGTIDSLLKDIEALKNILLYHVVNGKVMAEDVVKLTEAKALNGGKLMIDAKDGIKINDSMLMATDIIAENGIIHVVDKVLLP